MLTALVTVGPADLYNRVLCPTCILQIIAINTLLVRYIMLAPSDQILLPVLSPALFLVNGDSAPKCSNMIKWHKRLEMQMCYIFCLFLSIHHTLIQLSVFTRKSGDLY